MKHPARPFSALLLAPLLLAGTPQAINGTGVAFTGDTVMVSGTPVRLFGIAAPLNGQTCQTHSGREFDCFRQSSSVLQSLIGEQPVHCTIESTDRNGQAVGRCRNGSGVESGSAMVSRGWAFAYRQLSPAYASAEAFAQTHRLGLWASKVEKPWQWKSRQLRDTAR